MKKTIFSILDDQNSEKFGQEMQDEIQKYHEKLYTPETLIETQNTYPVPNNFTDPKIISTIATIPTIPFPQKCKKIPPI